VTDSDQDFSQDVKRAVLLGTYIAHWGMPKTRRVISSADGMGRIELYDFPASHLTGGIARLATIGVSDAFSQRDGESGIELLFAWLPNSTLEPLAAIEDLVLDAAVYVHLERMREQGVVLRLERGLASVEARKFLLDEPLAEEKSVVTIGLGAAHIHLLWLVPLFDDEAAFVSARGIDQFDEARRYSAQNLFRLNRSSILRP